MVHKFLCTIVLGFRLSVRSMVEKISGAVYATWSVFLCMGICDQASQGWGDTFTLHVVLFSRCHPKYTLQLTANLTNECEWHSCSVAPTRESISSTRVCPSRARVHALALEHWCSRVHAQVFETWQQKAGYFESYLYFYCLSLLISLLKLS